MFREKCRFFKPLTPSHGRFSNSFAEQNCRLTIAAANVGLVHIGLRHRTGVAGDSVGLVRRRAFGHDTCSNPDHTVLHRVDHQTVERIELVARQTL